VHERVGSRVQEQAELMGIKAIAGHAVGVQVSFMIFNKISKKILKK
jgi:hypothetical protein